MNNVQITGRLTSDPEMKEINGKSLVNFRIACNDNDKNPVFIQCEAWEKQADFIGNYFQKGKMILISSGSLKFSSWEDNDGNKRDKISLHVFRGEFCGDKGSDVGSFATDVAVEEDDLIL